MLEGFRHAFAPPRFLQSLARRFRGLFGQLEFMLRSEQLAGEVFQLLIAHRKLLRSRLEGRGAFFDPLFQGEIEGLELRKTLRVFQGRAGDRCNVVRQPLLDGSK